MFMVLSSRICNRIIARVHLVHAMNAEQRQTAADLWTKPTDVSRRSACRQHVTTSTIAIYNLLSPKADTHFTTLERVEGWVELNGWSHTQPVYLPASSRSPIQVLTGPSEMSSMYSRTRRLFVCLLITSVYCIVYVTVQCIQYCVTVTVTVTEIHSSTKKICSQRSHAV